MNRLSLKSLAQIAEIIAAVGVITSLVYVGFELSENTTAVRAGTSQAISDSSREFILDVILNEDLSRIRSLGSSDLSQLTDLEADRFSGLVLGNWIFFQNVWIQWTLGVVDDRVWKTYVGIFCTQLGSPGTRQAFERQKYVFDKEFTGAIEEICGESR